MPPPPPGNDFVEVDAGIGEFAVARRTNGTLVAWGMDWYGVLEVPGGSFISAAAGLAHGIAIVPSPGSASVGLCLVLALACGRRRR